MLSRVVALYIIMISVGFSQDIIGQLENLSDIKKAGEIFHFQLEVDNQIIPEDFMKKALDDNSLLENVYFINFNFNKQENIFQGSAVLRTIFENNSKIEVQHEDQIYMIQLKNFNNITAVKGKAKTKNLKFILNDKKISLVSSLEGITYCLILSSLLVLFLLRNKIKKWFLEKKALKQKLKTANKLLNDLKNAESSGDFELLYERKKIYYQCFGNKEGLEKLFNHINKYQFMPSWPDMSVQRTKEIAVNCYQNIYGEQR